MARVKVADIIKRDDFVGLVTAQKTKVVDALNAIALAFAEAPELAKQDNMTSLFAEAINQQVVE